MGIGEGDLAKDGDGGEDLVAERVGGDELRGDEEVAVEVGLDDLSLDLAKVVVVGAAVEVDELLLEAAAERSPLRRAEGEYGHGGGEASPQAALGFVDVTINFSSPDEASGSCLHGWRRD